MIKKAIIKLRTLVISVLKSYSQVFFSDNYLFAVLLIVVSFFNFNAGLCGFLAAAFTNGIGIFWGFDKYKIKQGLYGYNSIMVGLGLGNAFELNWVLIVLIVFASILTLFLTVEFEAFLQKYALPFLSIPFVLAMWIVLLSTRHITVLEFSQQGIFQSNELYSIGGKWLLELNEKIKEIPIIYSLKVYLYSLGAIFFQFGIVAGILVAVGLFYHSRISFFLSLLGFYTAYIFYKIAGINVEELGYNYIGYNFILTSIALGGFFVIPSIRSFFWVVLMLPVVVLISLSSQSILINFQLPVFSLPFNLCVLLFLYALKLRTNPTLSFSEVYYQMNSPEKNLYLFHNSNQRFKYINYYPISLPFWGEWFVSQGHNGEYTHKAEWQHAFDFEIKDNEGKTFKNNGNELSDYYCYNKAIIAPGYGIVWNIIDGIEDNTIGDMNINQNWGNVVVIKHNDFLYSKIAHIKAGSFQVKIGDYIKKGDWLANVGNSGRSPYPHIHFQLQATPYIGSKTINYPICQYILNSNKQYELKLYDIPVKGDSVFNMEINPLLSKSLHFIPGQKLKLTVNDNGTKYAAVWEVCTDISNNIYIYSPKTHSLAYFYNSGTFHVFKSYSGNKKDALFMFFMALYKVPLSNYKNLSLSDDSPVNLIPVKGIMFIHDFFAPFYFFIKTKYHIKSVYIDNEFSPENITLESSIKNHILKKENSSIQFQIKFENNHLSEIKAQTKRKTIELIFEKIC